MKKKQKIFLSDKHLTTLVTIIVALIGCVGTVAVAIIGYMSVSMQIEKPVAITQTVEAKIISSQTPTSILQNTPVPSFTETIVPTSTPEQTLISASTVRRLCERTILPDYIKPSDGIQQAIEQIAEAEARGEKFSLMGNNLSLKIEFRSEVQTVDWLKLSNNLKITITSDNNVGDKLNLWNVEGCGGGDYRFFSPDVSLETNYPAYSVNVENSEFDFFTLQPGEFESFDFNFYCRTPGIYTVNIELPYSLLDVPYNYNYTIPTTIICPKSFSVWNSYYAGMLEYGGDFMWNGEEYVPLQ
ncbi:MAG: hypothetical protein Q8L72_12550 [Moraxellaceae bacterium]|nr:hypothetical protein [Moraxellaceae bacterium]